MSIPTVELAQIFRTNVQILGKVLSDLATDQRLDIVVESLECAIKDFEVSADELLTRRPRGTARSVARAKGWHVVPREIEED